MKAERSVTMTDHRDVNGAAAASLKRLLKWIVRARDARWMWDLFGPVYNRHILEPLSDLYEQIARDLPVNSPARILDVGCGRGYVTLLLAGRLPSASLAGIDYSATQVRAAERLRKRRDLANCRFEQGNAMSIPFAGDHFDAVVSVGSIKHWKDAPQGLGEIRRVLAPGRWAVVSETDKGVSDEDLRRFMRRFHVWFLWDAILFWGLRNVVFGGSYTEREMVAMAHAAGFSEVTTDRVDDCPYVIVKARK